MLFFKKKNKKNEEMTQEREMKTQNSHKSHLQSTK